MAASSSPTSIPPLLDRSNKRHRFPNLDSSESTPSDNSSIYTPNNTNTNALPPAAKPAPPHSSSLDGRSSSEQQRARARASPTPHGPGIAVRFTNRPDATPLTTILEQRSASTLRERASQLLARASLHRPPSSGHTDTPVAADHGTSTARKDAVNRRQISWSINVDEATLRELHEIINNQRPARQDLKSASSLGSPLGSGSDPTRPFSPIYPAYTRISTPKGAPRWPGDLPTAVRAPTRQVSRARSVGHALRDLIRGPRVAGASGPPNRAPTVFSLSDLQPRTAAVPPRTGRAYWAPPRSGHGPFNAGITDQSYPLPDLGAGRSPEERQQQHEPVQHAPPRPGNPHNISGSNFRQFFTPHDHAALQNNIPRAASAAEVAATTSPSTPPDSGPSSQDLIPAPLFTSPPHSRQGLDPCVPESAYDRVSYMVNQEVTPSPLLTSRGSTTDADGPLHVRPSVTFKSLRDSNLEAAPGAQLAPTNPPFPTGPLDPGPSPELTPRTLYVPITRTPPPSRKPNQHLSPTNLVHPRPLHIASSPYSAARPATPPGRALIRSVALPSLLPIAAKEGIVRPRGQPLPRAVPASTRSTAPVPSIASVPSRASVRPGPSFCSAASAPSAASFHSAASTRAIRGSSAAAGCSASSSSGGTGETWRTARTAQAIPVVGGVPAPVVPEALRPKRSRTHAPTGTALGQGIQAFQKAGRRNKDRLRVVMRWCCCRRGHPGKCTCGRCTKRRARRDRPWWMRSDDPMAFSMSPRGGVDGMV